MPALLQGVAVGRHLRWRGGTGRGGAELGSAPQPRPAASLSPPSLRRLSTGSPRVFPAPPGAFSLCGKTWTLRTGGTGAEPDRPASARKELSDAARSTLVAAAERSSSCPGGDTTSPQTKGVAPLSLSLRTARTGQSFRPKHKGRLCWRLFSRLPGPTGRLLDKEQQLSTKSVEH